MSKARILFTLSALLLMFSDVLAQSISDTVDVLHYAIHLDEINTDEQTIQGHTVVELTSAAGGLSGAALQLKDLTADSVLHEGNTIDFTHDGELITFGFEDEIVPGESLVFDIYYHGSPFSESWGGFHFAGEYAYNLGVGFESIPHNLGKTWFPCVDDFSDKANYEYFISVDNSKKAVCGGILQETIPDGDKTIYHWVMENPIPTYLASVAIGEYVLYEDTFEGTEADIPVQIWVRPSEIDNVAGSFVNLKPILDVFEAHWGPYPFSRVGLVSTSNGAMEHATNIAYPYGTIDGGTNYEWLYAHELSHMWFGDKVTCASAEEMWLNEGWAVFNELLFREGIYGEGSWEDIYRDLHKEVLHYAHTPMGDGEYYALDSVPQEVTYGSHSYDKGGLVVHTLRNYLGDELFFPTMQGFLEEYAYQSASSEDLMNYLTSETGVDMAPFFENWVFSPGFPHFEIDSVIQEEENYRVFVQQKSKGRDQLFDQNILEVYFRDADWQLWSDTMLVSGSQSSKAFEVPFEPAMVMLDFEDKMADATTDENVTVDETGTISLSRASVVIEVESITDSAFLRVTHHWAAPDTLFEPVEGLRLSDYRYWSVDGVDLENMQASCRFYYNKNNYLDNTLLQNDGDEITLLYRSDQQNDWQQLDFTQIGPAMIGYLEIESLEKGEYTLAVWEEGYTNIEALASSTDLRVYPNPAKDFVNISTKSAGFIEIYSADGQLILQKQVEKSGKETWNTSGQKSGTYLIRHTSRQGKQSSQKIIIRK